MAREVLQKGKAQYSWPPVLANLDQLFFELKILFTSFTKGATLMRRSTVLSLRRGEVSSGKLM
jgi:hypothetical protein